MLYIPNDWLKNKDNQEKVHEILSRHLYTDLVLDTDDELSTMFGELEALGEPIIIEKVKDGTLRVD